MRSVRYSQHGESAVLRLVERPAALPQSGEVQVRVARSGVNPVDWKARRGLTGTPLLEGQVPGYDGAGVIEVVGPGVDPALAGRRVWVFEAGVGHTEGTAQESTVVPATNVAPLPDTASFDLGACLGIPFLTAHRCLTCLDGGPVTLGPGALDGRVVLVAGGAGAVGNAAIQLAKWSGARVVTTVSSPAKASLATASGADHTIDYRSEDVVAEVRRIAPGGVDCVVEVAPEPNAPLDARVVAPSATIAIYGRGAANFPARLLSRSVRVQYVLVFMVPPAAKAHAVEDVTAALVDGAVRVGERAGLPLLHFALERTGEAHDAVEQGAVGKVLVDVASED